mgnify:CR=1 FL=1
MAFADILEKKISNLLEKHLPAKMSKKDFINLINYKNNILESELLRLETYLLDWRVKEKDLLGLSS